MAIGETRPSDPLVAELRALLDQREREIADLRLNEDRLAEAQRVGAMGSYDWHIPSDTNTWSDELYRIYGTEPQSFNASYERFMGFIHPDDREKVKAVHMQAFQDHGSYHMEERIVRPDGEIRILDSTGEVSCDDEGNPVRMYGICRDITAQRRAEEEARLHAQRLHDAEIRRRQALEINDNVVQGLSAALYAFDVGLDAAAIAALHSTVVSARLMMNDLLASSDDEELEAGGLERARPAACTFPAIPDLADVNGAAAVCRVMLVDDAADIRLILRRVFTATPGFAVVGEASDGQAAIEMAATLAPDLVILDLAMPVMDGLEALPRIRAQVPRAKIVVLSGFDGSRMREPALLAGADAYIEKGGNLAAVLATIGQLVGAAV
jgi:PAS domain S-box-containing protein